jgi:hypothetical protein
MPSSSALIPMSICTLQCLFSRAFRTSESADFSEISDFENPISDSDLDFLCSQISAVTQRYGSGDTSPQFKFRDQMLVSPDCMLPFWNETAVVVSKR